MRMRELEQRTSAWLDWRSKGITATESAVILGLNPYKTPWRLWCEKTGRADPPDLSANPLVRFGQENEDRVRRLFEAKHADIVLPVCGEYEADPVFRASFDGLNSAGEPVEIKCLSETTIAEVRLIAEASPVYALYRVQVQHQLLVSGAARGWLVFFDRAAEELIEFEVARDETLIGEILSKGRAFWDRYLVPGKEPPKDPARDLYIPKTDEEINRWCLAAADFCALDAQVAELQARIDDLNVRRKACRDALISMMGSYRYADYAGVALTLRANRGAVDYKAVLKAKGITDADLDSHRSKPSQSWLVRRTGSVMPKDFKDEGMQQVLEAHAVPEAMWF